MNSILSNLDVVLQYIIMYGPSIVAAIASISSIVVAIKKCGQIKEESAVESRKLKNQMSDNLKQMNEILKENSELKKQVSTLMQDIHKIYKGE